MILSTAFFKENYFNSVDISLKFVLRGQIDIKFSIGLDNALARIADKPLLEPKMTQLNDIIWYHWGTMI